MLKKPLYFLLLSLFSASLIVACSNQAEAPDPSSRPIKLKNSGFELSDDLPEGWTLSQHTGGPAYKVSIDQEQFSEGKQSLKFTRIDEQVWGMLSQYLKFRGKAGKKISLSAMVKGKGLKSKGFHLALHFRKNTSTFISDAKSVLLTGDSEWHKIEFSTIVPEQTAILQVAAILLDDGTVWLDDIKLSMEK